MLYLREYYTENGKIRYIIKIYFFGWFINQFLKKSDFFMNLLREARRPYREMPQIEMLPKVPLT
jgi:hypothetical protein